MRKILGLMIGVAFVIGTTTLGYADDTTGKSTAAGAEITISNTNNSSAAVLKYTPSPGVVMGWATSDTAYAINTQNTKASDDNGLQFGFENNSSQYKQRKRVADGVFAAPTAAGTLDGTWFTPGS